MLLLREKVEDVPEHAAVCLIEFGVFAALTGDVGEFLILDVEDFTDEAAGCSDFAEIVSGVPAFGADEINIFAHFFCLTMYFSSLKSEGWNSFILALFNIIAEMG
ncbi:hypothetical protein MSLAZ_2125 [Methanosarcina lacustris Z-7289]|uniref:Uncharacterized protein n=1 Tax=Methanosarcina lacustris Z-7289 TaxID=1434111 RepID=A0A0E3S531_9EURY|nr:hypothetical protein MSLAZ_2125 [Methanosarcina lacustris Z-7289]